MALLRDSDCSKHFLKLIFGEACENFHIVVAVRDQGIMVRSFEASEPLAKVV